MKHKALIAILFLAVFSYICADRERLVKPSVTAGGDAAVDIYLPEYKVTGYDGARYYARCFGTDSLVYEDAESYLFAAKDEELKVFKDISYLEYKSADKPMREEIGGAREAAESGARFLNNRHITLPYGETKIEESEEGYSITFAGMLGGLPNYAFAHKMTMDSCGNVETLNLYFNEYEKIGSAKIKPISLAALSLPDMYKDCCGRLVYFYEDSVVKAGYLFEKKTDTGEIFEYCVSASEH